MLVFDLKALKVTAQVATGQNPDAISYEPVSGRVFTFNGRSNDATAVDARTGTVLGTIPLGGKPEFAQLDGKGMIYVNNEDTREILEIDARALKVTRKWPLAPCQSPSGLALDLGHRRLFSVCANQLMAISDTAAGKLLTTLPIGAGSDGVAFDPGTGLVVSANGDGTMTFVKQVSNNYAVVETLKTEPRARTITVDTATHRFYSPAAEFGPLPAPTAASPRPRPTALPDTFHLLVVGR